MRTDGPDGKPAEFEIAYTFGADPLQQYLVPFPDGRLQTLGLAWDTRPRSQGGQRWFHLYPEHDAPAAGPAPLDRPRADLELPVRRVPFDEPPEGVRPRHEPLHDDLGGAHRVLRGVPRARLGPRGLGRGAPGRGAPGRRPAPTGLVVRLGRGDGAWAIKDTARGIAEWTGPAARLGTEVDVCARCHARRRPIVEPHPVRPARSSTPTCPRSSSPGSTTRTGRPSARSTSGGPSSRAACTAPGVTCSDCHEPHRAALRVPGNGVCAQCHLPARFDTPAHHHHRARLRCRPLRELSHAVAHPHGRGPAPGSQLPGAPARSLGQARHTERVHGLPRDRPPQWAADRIQAWGGPPEQPRRGSRPRSPPRGAGSPKPGRRWQPSPRTGASRRSRGRRRSRTSRSSRRAAMGPAVESGLRDPDALVRMAALGGARGARARATRGPGRAPPAGPRAGGAAGGGPRPGGRDPAGGAARRPRERAWPSGSGRSR